MTDVHTALLEAHAWDGQTNDRGIAIIKFCEGWPKADPARNSAKSVIADCTGGLSGLFNRMPEWLLMSC